MSDQTDWNETLVDKEVTYHIEVDGRLLIIENVPTRVNVETGENHFSPETVKRLQHVSSERSSPICTIRTLIYEFA